jgi:hypothetical protein
VRCSALDVLEQGVQEFRQFYVSPDLHKWISGVLPASTSAWKIELTPLEQFVDLAETFCAGDRLMYGLQLKPLTHITDGIWEIKTPDIRNFRMVPEKRLLRRRGRR